MLDVSNVFNKNILLLLIAVLLFTNISNLLAREQFDGCQDRATKIKPFEVGKVEYNFPKDSIKEDKFFYVLEPMPIYPGGEKALLKFITNNLEYPKSAQEAEIEGRVIVGFVVDRDGSVTHVEVRKGIDPALDNAAVDVVKKMPKWIPVKQRVYLTLPIDFRLERDTQKEAISLDTIVSDKEEGIDIKELRDSIITVEEEVEEEPYHIVEQMPIFPGGEKSMYKFISDSLKCPVKLFDSNIQGSVVVRFIVKSDGSVADVRLLRKLDPDFDKEVVEMIKKMPKWIPGKHKGKAVSIYYPLRIPFSAAKRDYNALKK